MMKRLSDYPLGVQDLLKWAGYYLEQLDILEREFRAWEVSQDTEHVQAITLSIAGSALEAHRLREASEQPVMLTRAEAARQRWEARVESEIWTWVGV